MADVGFYVLKCFVFIGVDTIPQKNPASSGKSHDLRGQLSSSKREWSFLKQNIQCCTICKLRHIVNHMRAYGVHHWLLQSDLHRFQKNNAQWRCLTIIRTKPYDGCAICGMFVIMCFIIFDLKNQHLLKSGLQLLSDLNCIMYGCRFKFGFKMRQKEP